MGDTTIIQHGPSQDANPTYYHSITASEDAEIRIAVCRPTQRIQEKSVPKHNKSRMTISSKDCASFSRVLHYRYQSINLFNYGRAFSLKQNETYKLDLDVYTPAPVSIMIYHKPGTIQAKDLTAMKNKW